MRTNIGKADKTIRLLLAILIAGVGIYSKSWWALFTGLVLLFTAFISFCPLYTVLGIKTSKEEHV